MDGFMLWFAEHIGTVLAVALATFLALFALAVRSAWQAGRQLERRLRPWLAFAGALLFVGVTGLGLFFFASGAVQMGPALWAQGKLQDHPAPELLYTKVVDGSAARLAAHQGQVVVVNLWATWCPPCRAEMPDLDRLQKTYRDRGLVVLQISNEDRETLAAYLESSPMTTEHGCVEDFPWPAPGTPTTYVVDREGVVRKAIVGGRSFEQFEQEVTKYL